MNERIQYFTKLSSFALVSLLKVYLVTFVNLLITFSIGLFFLIANYEETFLMIAFLRLGMLILIVLITAALLVFTSRYIVRKIIHKIIYDHSESLLIPLLERALIKFKGQPLILNSQQDDSSLKEGLIGQVKIDHENTWIKRVVIYGIKKLVLSPTDFNKREMDTSEILRQKIMNTLREVTEPDRIVIWLLLLLQWIFMAGIIFF